MFPPQILIIGSGRFGQHYLRHLSILEKKGTIGISGILVKTKASQKELQEHSPYPVYTHLDLAVINNIDAAFILTPTESHFSWIKKLLPYCHVYTEKPLVKTDAELAELSTLVKASSYHLMCGHIYRFDALVKQLKKHLSQRGPTLTSVSARFVSPAHTDNGAEIAKEYLHAFDIMDTVFEQEPQSIFSRQSGRLMRVDCLYPNHVQARFTLGWQGQEKTRRLSFEFVTDSKHKEYIDCDLSTGTLGIRSEQSNSQTQWLHNSSPLEEEIQTFLDVAFGSALNPVDFSVASRVWAQAQSSDLTSLSARPKVAIIGAGIFGLTAALKLSNFADVDIFEKEGDIMTQASLVNQYRHHEGFHYPRSPETIQAIKDAKNSFEALFSAFIVRDYPSYYFISRENSYVDAHTFKQVFSDEALPFSEDYPDPKTFNRDTVTCSLKTQEAVYDYDGITQFFKRTCKESESISLHTSSPVTGISLSPQGKKILDLKNGHSPSYDFVLNASYSRYNMLPDWLHTERKSLKFFQKELVVIELPSHIEPCALTIMDGPFATIVPLGKTGLYTLGDVPLSVHKEITADDFESNINFNSDSLESRYESMFKRCQTWFPILKDAKYVKSLFIVLPVESKNENTDARPTDVTDHGYGCLSVLSGKIITAVKAADIVCDHVRGLDI